MDKAILKLVKSGFTVIFKPDYDIKGTFRLELHKGDQYVYDTLSYDFKSEPPVTWENILDQLVIKHQKLYEEK